MIDIDSFYKDKFKSMGIEFYNKDLSRESMVNIANGSIDVIMLNHLIEHISDIGFFIAEIKRMLKNGGKVYIRTPDIKKVKFSFYDDFTHVRPFSKHGLKHMMNVFGFKELATINSNSDTLKLEEYFDVKPGALSFLGAKEIESAWEKIQS